jgi:ABC-type Zn uptake system ZnuABC Zn-binding protein ZnuA
MSKPSLRVFAALIAVIWLASSALVTTAGAQEQEPDKLKVVASFSILEDFVANVGGDAVELESIVPAGGDAHSFDPEPDQVASVGDADLVVEIGIGFEPWLADMMDASGSDAQLVTVTNGLDLIDGQGDDHEAEASPEDEDHAGEDHDHDHDTGGIDPHVWGDVANVIAITDTVKNALIAADPERAEVYETNAGAYTEELLALDTWVRDQVGTLPEDQRKLVTSHDTFGYFARAYGFEVVGTAIGSVTTESGDPSAEDIANLVDQIESTGVTAIFAENVSNPDLIDAIASEAGVSVGPALYTDALGEPGSDGDTYIKLVTWNVTSIVTALSA